MHGMTKALFSIANKQFLVADLNYDIILEMIFFKLTDHDIHFSSRKFSWRSYTAANSLVTLEQVKTVASLLEWSFYWS